VRRVPCPELGQGVELPERVERIVSFSPGLTGAMSGPGLGSRPVGRSAWCRRPPEVEKLPGVGGFPEARTVYLVSGAYDLLVLPGGKAPETVRLDRKALAVTRRFFEKKRPVGAICHGPQVLISAGLVEGRTLTCWKGIKDDVIAAGGRYVDCDVAEDRHLVTSRRPEDLPAFLRSLLAVAVGTGLRRTAAG